MPQLSGAIWT